MANCSWPKWVSSNLHLYKRYVDDILVFSDKKDSIENFVSMFNALHPNLSVTYEIEKDGILSFLDTLLSRRSDGSIKRGVYRKPSWTGQCIHFNSFAPVKYKQNLVQTLLHRAREICTSDCISDDLPPLVCLIYILCYWFAIDKTIRNDIILHSLSSEFTIQICKGN